MADPGADGKPAAGNDNAPVIYGAPKLPNEFEIEIPEKPGHPWNAANGKVGVTVFTGADPRPTSKTLADGRAWHIWKNNVIKTEPGHVKEQWLIAELNGVFIHINDNHETGRVAVVIANERLS